jgi:hypothetical protein
MYAVDSKDTVAKIPDVPQSSIGAPCPMILAGEGHLHLAYYIEVPVPGWDGKTVRVVGENTSGDSVALVTFKRPYAQMFGPPNDEAFRGHPLTGRGLSPYGVFEIGYSSWIRGLERMNSVHPSHRPERFDCLRHFVFAFHDTTFECVAKSFEFSIRQGSVVEILENAVKELRR